MSEPISYEDSKTIANIVYEWQKYRVINDFAKMSELTVKIDPFIRKYNISIENVPTYIFHEKMIEEEIETDCMPLAYQIYHSKNILAEQKLYLRMKWSFME